MRIAWVIDFLGAACGRRKFFDASARARVSHSVSLQPHLSNRNRYEMDISEGVRNRKDVANQPAKTENLNSKESVAPSLIERLNEEVSALASNGGEDSLLEGDRKEKVPLMNADKSANGSVDDKDKVTNDRLSWLHSIVFTTSCLAAYCYWILFLPHENFKASGDSTGDIYLKQICRQLNSMIYEPVEYEFHSFRIWGMNMPVWNVFFTLEAVLLSARFLTMQVTRKNPPFRIPDIFRPAMVQFGMDPSFYEKLIASVYGYYEMYDTFMRDLYLIISLIGLSAFTAAIATNLGLCH